MTDTPELAALKRIEEKLDRALKLSEPWVPSQFVGRPSQDVMWQGASMQPYSTTDAMRQMRLERQVPQANFHPQYQNYQGAMRPPEP